MKRNYSPFTKTGSGNYTDGNITSNYTTYRRLQTAPHTLHTPPMKEKHLEGGEGKKYNITETHSDCLMAPSVTAAAGTFARERNI